MQLMLAWQPPNEVLAKLAESGRILVAPVEFVL